MFEPIMTQEQLDRLISDRLKRDRDKIRKKHADDLQPLIDETKSLYESLRLLQSKWRNE